MSETQQLNQSEGIALFAQEGHDFQPLATGQYVNAYAWARAVIVDPTYRFSTGDKISFSLTGASAIFISNGQQTIALSVTQLDSTNPIAWGVDSHALRFKSTGDTQVTLAATFSGSDGSYLSGDREFTFITLPVASSDQLGCVKVGDGLSIQDGVLSAKGGGSSYTLPAATANTLGGVKQGKNVSIALDGTLSVADPGTPESYTLPAATASTLGGVIVGEGLQVTGDGTTSLAPASTTQLGGVKQGKNVTIALDGTLSVADPGTPESYTLPAATASTLGGVIVGEGLQVTGDGTTSLAPASTTQLGGVTQGDYVTIASGKLSVDPSALTPSLTHASGDDYGTAKAGAGLTNTNGVFAVDYSAVVDNLRHADAGNYGVVKPGTGMSASNGVLNVNAASASAAGIVVLASDAEVAAGTDNATAVTPMGAKHVYAPLADPHLTGTVSVTQETDDVKMQVVKSTTSAGTAATTLGTQSIYLQLGGGEYSTNSYRMVGLGFRDLSRPIPPLLVGLEETDGAGATKGDFLVATRDSTAYSAPTEKFRITSDGRAKVTNDQTANDYTVQDQELVTFAFLKEYLKGGSVGLAITSPADGSEYWASDPSIHRPAAGVNANGTAVPLTDVSLTLNGASLGVVAADSSGKWDCGRLNLPEEADYVLTASSNGKSVSSHFSVIRNTP